MDTPDAEIPEAEPPEAEPPEAGTPEPGEGHSLTGLVLALGGYTVLFAGKLAAYLLTGVGVLYAEALHSLADMLITGFLLTAAIWSRREADERYRFGYERAQNVAALVAATIFISFTALEVFREGIGRLTGGEETTYSHLELAAGVTVAALVISAVPLLRIWLAGEKGAASRAQLVESVNDEVALVAALAGIAFIWKGVSWADGVASLVVGAVIVVNAALLWKDNAQRLMGRSPGQDLYEQIDEIVRSVNGVVGLHEMRAELVGDAVHLGMHIEVPWGTKIEEADRIAEEVHAEIGLHIRHAYCVIHVDPEGVR